MVVYPIMFRALYSPGGAGFLPSTVCSQPTPNPPTNKANTQDPSSSHPTMAPLVNANSMTGHVSLAYTLAIQLVSTWQAVFFGVANSVAPTQWIKDEKVFIAPRTFLCQFFDRCGVDIKIYSTPDISKNTLPCSEQTEIYSTETSPNTSH